MIVVLSNIEQTFETVTVTGINALKVKEEVCWNVTINFYEKDTELYWKPDNFILKPILKSVNQNFLTQNL